jgi:hypothetical protein
MDSAIDGDGVELQLSPMGDEHRNVRLSRDERRSNLWWLTTFAASIVIFLIGSVWFLLPQAPRVPVYHGKALTVWLRTYASSSSSGRYSREWNEADDAVRHSGTNCIPILLRMIREKDSKLKLLVVSLARKQRIVKMHLVTAAERNVEASRAFIVLGDMAKGAVPVLVKMYDEDLSADSRSAIEDALAWIGPASKPAIRLLLRSATNSDRRVRANALWALGEIRAQPELCVPVLTNALTDSDGWVQLSAAHALGMFGAQAQSAVPSLRQLTNVIGLFNSSGTVGLQVSLEARIALTKIESGAVSPPSRALPESGIPLTDWLLSPQ